MERTRELGRDEGGGGGRLVREMWMCVQRGNLWSGLGLGLGGGGRGTAVLRASACVSRVRELSGCRCGVCWRARVRVLVSERGVRRRRRRRRRVWARAGNGHTVQVALEARRRAGEADQQASHRPPRLRRIVCAVRVCKRARALWA